MHVRMAMIITPYLDTWIHPNALGGLTDIDLEIFVVEDGDEAQALLSSLADSFDGFYIGDFVLYHYLCHMLPGFKKPLWNWQAGYADYCDELLSTAFASRRDHPVLLCDFALLQGYRQIDNLISSHHLHRLFLHCGSFLRALGRTELLSAIDAACGADTIPDHALLVTSSGLLAAIYEKQGISVAFIPPSAGALQKELGHCARALQCLDSPEQPTGVMTLALRECQEAVQEPILQNLATQVLHFAQMYQIEIHIHHEHNRIEVRMSKSSLHLITYGGQTCLLSNYLRRRVLQRCAIGYGAGDTLSAARYASLLSLYDSQMCADEYSYLCDDTQTIPRPLSGSGPLPVAQEPWLSERARDSGVPAEVYQQLIATALHSKGSVFSARQLAKELKMSLRTVYRLVQKLEDAGDIESQMVDAKQRGRPEKRYKITWL